MRLPAYLLGLLAVAPLNPLVLSGCGADDNSDPEEAQTALTSQAADGGVAESPDGAAAPENKSPPVLPTDPCPACGLG